MPDSPTDNEATVRAPSVAPIKPWRRRILSFFEILAIVGCAIGASLTYHLQLPITRRVVRDVLCDFISHEIRGELRIGRIDVLNPFRVVAVHPVLFDPAGTRVVTARRVELTPDLFSALRGVLRFRRAKLTDGFIRLIESDNGLPTWIRTFEPADPTPGTGKPLHAIVDGMQLERVTVYGDLLGLKGLRLIQLSAVGRLEAEDELEIRVYRAQGNLVRPYPFVARLHDLSAIISTVDTRGLRLWGGVRTDRDRLFARVKFAAPRKDADHRLRITVDCQPVTPQTLAAIGLPVVDSISSPLRGKLRIRGLPSDLRLRANMDSRGGRAELRGRISDVEGIQLLLRTGGLKLDRVLHGGPDLELSGEGRLTVFPDTQPDRPPEIQAAVNPFTYKGLIVPGLNVNATIMDDYVRLESVRGPHLGGFVMGKGRVGFDGSYDLRIRARLPHVGRDPNLQLITPGLRGRLEADLRLMTVASHLDHIRFEGFVRVRDIDYGAVSAQVLELRGSGRGDPERPELKLIAHGEGVTVANYVLGTANLSLNGGPRRYQSKGSFHAPGDRRVEFGADIEASRDAYTLQAKDIEFAVGNLVWRGAAENVRLRPGHSVTADMIRLANGTQRLEIKGAYRFHGPEELEAQLQDFDLTALVALIGPEAQGISGRADTHLVLRGDGRKAEVVLEGAFRDGEVMGLHVDNGVYVFSYKRGTLALDAQVDLGDRGLLAANGSGTIETSGVSLPEAVQRGRYLLQFDLDRFDLSVLERITKGRVRNVLGRLTGHLGVAGTAADPHLEGDVRVDNLILGNFPSLGVVSTFRYENAAFELSRLEISDRTGILLGAEGRANFDVNRLYHDPGAIFSSLHAFPWRLSVIVPRRRIDTYPEPISSRIPYPFLASLSLTAYSDQRELVSDMHASVEWAGELINRTRPRFTVDATLRNNVARATIAGFLQERRLLDVEAQAEVPVEVWLSRSEWPEAPPVHISARTRGLAVADVPILREYAEGVLDIDVRIEDFFTPRVRGRGHIRSSGLSLVRPSVGRRRRNSRRVLTDPIELDSNFQFANHERVFRTNGQLIDSRAGRAIFFTSIPFRWDQPRTFVPEISTQDPLSIEVILQAARLQPILAWIPALADGDASATGRFQARGAIARANMQGTLQLEQGHLEFIGLGQQLTDLGGTITFQGQSARLRGFHVEDGDGNLRFDGTMGFRGLIPSSVDLSILASKFPIRREGSVLATLTGDATLTGEIRDDQSEAELTTGQMTLRLAEDNARSLQPLESHPDVQVLGQKPEEEDSESDYPLLVSLDADRPFWIRRSDFSALVSARLQVTYRDPELFVGGTTTIRRGFFEIFGKRFDIDRGSLNFDGSSELNPQVDLQATHSLVQPRGTTVTVRVGGRLLTPTVEFASSHPECDERAEVIALLVSGRCVSDNSAAINAQSAGQQAGSFLAGLTAGILTLSARRELGEVLPVIVIESGSEGFQSARVRAGFQADSVIPPFLRDVVQGAYVEGVFTAAGSQQSTDYTAVRQGTGVGFLLELQFPYSIVGRGTYTPPENWGVDFTWEP